MDSDWFIKYSAFGNCYYSKSCLGEIQYSKAKEYFVQDLGNLYDLCCKALLNKSVVIYLNSKTYKMIALKITTLSFIILTYYKAQMNAALNVHIEKFPINNWDEAYSKDFNIIFYFGSYTESIFKNSPGLQKLYEKVMSSHYTKDLGSIGVKTSVKEILKGYTIAVEEASVYKYLDIYPCEITELKSMR